MRPCLTCGEATPRTRCPQHESELNIALGSSHQRGYGSRWRRLSERKRRVTPFCELHLPGCQLVAVDVDHRIPIRAGGRSTWANAQSTCRPCHAQKTRLDAERFPNAA